MIRQHENSDAWKAGIFAISVHALLLAGMLFSFNWKAAHPFLNLTEVELWDKLPSTQSPTVVEPPKPLVEELPKPIVEESPKVEVEQPKPEEPKVDIELENKKKEIEKKELEDKAKLEKLSEQKKQKELDKKKKLEALQAELREDALEDKKADEKKQKDALKKLQQDSLSDENTANEKQASAANASEIGKYTEKIKAKIRGNVNKTLCAEGNPELRFEINLLPTGELSGSPKITKSSGNSACDEAVERAIIASSTSSSPLPLPTNPALKAQFRNLKLTFKPND
jgi:colicin import membrane protein